MKSIIHVFFYISLLVGIKQSVAQNPASIDTSILGDKVGFIIETESNNTTNVEWIAHSQAGADIIDCTSDNIQFYPELTDIYCGSSLNFDVAFGPISFESLFSLSPSFTGVQDYLNGVSTLDMVLITRHILGINPLDSEYRIIAADVNANGSITAVDLLEMRKLILGINTTISNNFSWVAYADNVIEGLNYDIPVIGCTAVKIGDVNGSSVSGIQSNTAIVESRSTTSLIMKDQKLKSGVTYSIAVSADDDLDIYGLQLTLLSDESQISDLSIESAALTITPESIHNQAAHSGKTSIAWMDVDFQHVKKNKALFYINFMANEDTFLSDVLQLTEAPTPSLMVDKNLEEKTIDLKYTTSSSGFRVFPNPTKDILQIYGEQDGKSTSRLYDQYGGLILSKSHNGATQIQVAELSNGVYFLQLESEEGVIQTQKIFVQH